MTKTTTKNTSTSTTTSASTSTSSTNVVWHETKVTREARWKIGGHPGVVLWFTGLSGAGKSSIANQVEVLLNQKDDDDDADSSNKDNNNNIKGGGISSSGGYGTYILDGDNIRHGLCNDLGFSVSDRIENIRRVGHASQLLADSGCIVLTALISPYRKDRDHIRHIIETTSNIKFVEIYVQTSLEVCENRDCKGLYQLARSGQIINFTGIDDPYEEPMNPELILNSNGEISILNLAKQVISWLQENNILSL